MEENEVCMFINEFVDAAKSYGIEENNLYSLFMCGYCYYFAYMLYNAFDRGEVCVAAPYGHVVWKDVDGRCYDFGGEYRSDYEALIPVEDLESHAIDFKHIPTNIPGITKDELNKLIDKYKED